MRNRAEDQITLVLIRHGATAANRERRYLGKTDEPLSAEGREELLQYRKAGCYPAVDCLFTSPMKRCVQTAELLYPGLVPRRIGEWTEMDFGAFEGRNYQELCGDARYQAWIDSNGMLPFPEGESREDFIRRCKTGFHRMQAQLEELQNEKKIRSAGIIVHGGTIMALLSSYCGGEYFDYQAPNAKGYVCAWTGGKNTPELTQIKKLGRELK